MDEGTEFMQKPLEPEAVAKKVRQILDAAKDPGDRSPQGHSAPCFR